jgi:K(+)-stimulated pyrophosphate-energized sodium pump
MSHLNLQPFEFYSLWVVLGIALLGLAYALLLRSQIMSKDKGDAKMLEV